MNWIKFTDPRPEFGFAYVCGTRNFRWLFRLHPQDVLQTLSLALTAEPEVGRPLANRIAAELGQLAHALGFYKPTVEGTKRSWVADSQLRSNQVFDGKRMTFRGAPPCGTPSCYRNGCRSEECVAANRLRAKGYYHRQQKAAV